MSFKLTKDLVSIVMPAYNCENYIGAAIDSVISQTYSTWELIIVDDGSKDKTGKVVENYSLNDARVRYYKFPCNFGAAVARNKAVELSKGQYMAFLDSDDIWFPEKLEKQIKFMKKYNFSFTCTSYNKIDANGAELNQVVEVKSKSNYEDILKRNLGNSTVIYDSSVLGKFTVPKIKKRNDYVMWLQVIKKAKILYGLTEPLSSHRVRSDSLSKNKLKLVKYHWIVYRKIEKLSLIQSSYLILYWIFNTLLKFKFNFR